MDQPADVSPQGPMCTHQHHITDSHWSCCGGSNLSDMTCTVPSWRCKTCLSCSTCCDKTPNCGQLPGSFDLHPGGGVCEVPVDEISTPISKPLAYQQGQIVHLCGKLVKLAAVESRGNSPGLSVPQKWELGDVVATVPQDLRPRFKQTFAVLAGECRHHLEDTEPRVRAGGGMYGGHRAGGGGGLLGMYGHYPPLPE